MEPELVTALHVIPVLEELQRREPIFHHAEVGTKRDVFERMTATEFWEVGASGRRYSRDYVIEKLVERFSEKHEDYWEAHGFHCIEIAPDNYLITYTLTQDGQRVTRRSTLWRRTAEDWEIVYHQGTPVVEDA